MSRKNQHSEIRWNAVSTPEPDSQGTHHWLVLIVNKKNRVETIWQRFLEAAQPTEEARLRAEGTIPSHSLVYRLYSAKSFNVTPRNIDWTQIPSQNVSRDKELYERQFPEGVETYVRDYIEEKFQ